MSWDIGLNDPTTGHAVILEKPHDLRGGTYAAGGTNEAWLNVTYNYGKHFQFRQLAAMNAADSISILETAIEKLSDDISRDYWEPTQGNVKSALQNLLWLAQQRPDAIWEVR